MNTITFFFGHEATDNVPITGSGKGFLSTPLGILKENVSIDISQEILADNIRETVTKLASVFDPITKEMQNYVVDEIEFGLTIGADGKVGIIAAEATASMDATITVKLKRKES